MFNNTFFKHNTVVQFATTAGIAILISLYAVAQGFTLPLHFESQPKTEVLTTPLGQSSAGQATNPTPTAVNTPTSHTSLTTQNANPSNSPYPSTPSVLPKQAQEVADLPLRVAEISNEGASKALGQTQQAIVPIISEATQTVNNLTGVLTKDK
jgi:hypothetical protein